MNEESTVCDDPEVRQALGEVEQRPDSARGWARLGRLLFRRGRYEAAETAFRQQVALAPEAALGWANLALTLRRRHRPHEAMTAVQRSLGIDPDLPVARNHLAGILGDLGAYTDAVTVLEELVAETPGATAFQANLGNALRRVRRFEESIAVLEGCLQADPSHPSHHWNLAIACFQAGDWARAFEHAEWRVRRPGIRPPAWIDEAWDGVSSEGPLWVATEQGLGDAVQFVRFAEDAAERGGPVVVTGKPQLAGLLSTAAGVSRVTDEAPPASARKALLMSLPALLGLTGEALERPRPYLRADPERIRRTRRVLPAREGPLVGIAWQGNPKHPEDRHRSFRLSDLEPLARIPGVRLISLQRDGEGPASFPVHRLPGDFDTEGAFLDTAAVMHHLDLVVACDSAVAHVAGAVGCPCFLALAYAPDWRWQPGRETTPWYPEHRLFFQPRPGDWASVFEAMAQAVQSGIGAPQPA